MIKQIILGLSLALASSVALAAHEQHFDDWDIDNDDVITETEFTKGFAESGLYDSWDDNDDGVLSEDEFGSGVYDIRDADDNDDLNEDEWMPGGTMLAMTAGSISELLSPHDYHLKKGLDALLHCPPEARHP